MEPKHTSKHDGNTAVGSGGETRGKREALRRPARSRRAYAAAHVVSDLSGTGIDWQRTLAVRERLWNLGFHVAEAMDTAQRGAELDWELARELIAKSSTAAAKRGAKIASGANTDQLSADEVHPLEAISRAFQEQIEFITAQGSGVIIMASRALAKSASSADDYRQVYNEIFAATQEPVILHWLGTVFDSQLAGYWGHNDATSAMDVVASMIESNRAKIDGIKVSLLDKDLEIALRRRLPLGVRLYTGDDFHFDELIKGDEHGHSDALLGVFDPIASVAAAALEALDDGDLERYDKLLEPTIPLARVLFESPTSEYKCGVVFLAYVNGLQEEFRMLGGRETCRDSNHLARVFELAVSAGVLDDPYAARIRAERVLGADLG